MSKNITAKKAVSIVEEKDGAKGATLVAQAQEGSHALFLVEAPRDGQNPRRVLVNGAGDTFQGVTGDTKTATRKLERMVAEHAEDDRIRAELQGMVRTLTDDDFEAGRVSTPAAVEPGDVVYCHAMNAWRRGIVLSVAKTRATVAYTTASSGGRIFRKAQKPAELQVIAQDAKPAEVEAPAVEAVEAPAEAPKGEEAPKEAPAKKAPSARAVPEKAAHRTRQAYLTEVGMDRYRQQYNAGWDAARYGAGVKKAASGEASVAWMDGYTDAKACDGNPTGKWAALRATTAPVKKVTA